MREVDSTVGAGGTAEEGGFEFSFVHPDGDVGVKKGGRPPAWSRWRWPMMTAEMSVIL